MYYIHVNKVHIPLLSESHTVNYSGTLAIVFLPNIILSVIKKTTGIVLVSSSN